MAIDKKKSPYKASITREQFLFYEMRTTAKLLDEGLDDKEVVQRIIDENLFQYPTEKSVERMAKACIARLKNMNDEALISEIAKQPIRCIKADMFVCNDERKSIIMGFYDYRYR